MQIKKQKMLEKLDKMLTKGKLVNKDEFYKQIFNTSPNKFGKIYLY